MFERGVASTTLDDVRATASVSKSQLYHYFADKDDLVRAVVDHTVQEVLDAQPRLADLSSWSAIAAWFEDLVGLQAARHAVGARRANFGAARLAIATLASIQGGPVLTQTPRDSRQLRIALDAAYGHLRSFAA